MRPLVFETIKDDTTLLTLDRLGLPRCVLVVYQECNTTELPTHTQTTTQHPNNHTDNQPTRRQPPNTQTTTKHPNHHPTHGQPPNTETTTQHPNNHPTHNQPPIAQTTTQPLNTSLVRWSVACAPPLFMFSGYLAARDRRIPY